MTFADLDTESRAFVHELAEQQRRATEQGYNDVLDHYGWYYANGWRSGRNRLADLIDPEVQK